jgi:hypothetical protein
MEITCNLALSMRDIAPIIETDKGTVDPVVPLS